MISRIICSTLILAGCATASLAEQLNLYSSRHYETDERLYSDFEEATGITINRIEGKADELLARIVAEGRNSPADVFLTVDTVRLSRAKKAGILSSVESDMLEARIPAYLQDSDNQWFAFSQRARILFYDKADVPNPPQTYADLMKDEYAGMICIRSSGNVYSQNILAAFIAHYGEGYARAWAEAVAGNFARTPQGGDTDQLRGIVSGECDIAMSNTYYFGRALRRDVSGLSDHIDQIGWVFPDQGGNGAHMNISGGGVAAHAPNRENAIRFLEYLASDQAQQYFSAGNDEYPAVPGVALAPSMAAMGLFRQDAIELSAIADHIETAQDIFNTVGWP